MASDVRVPLAFAEKQLEKPWIKPGPGADSASELHAQLQEEIDAGIKEEMGDTTLRELARERDGPLIDFIALRKSKPGLTSR